MKTMSIGFICGIFLFQYAVRAAEKDTTKTYHAADVVITATRTSIAQSDAPSAIHLITSETIRQFMGTSLADVLRYAHGVDMKDYGAAGSMKNIKLRGLSTENTAILIDGQSINNPQYGSMDLSLLSLDAFEKMEVLRSGASALYGGNALGGVINLVTRRASEGLHARMMGEAGSFGAIRLFGEVQSRIGDGGLLINASSESGNDNFPFFVHRTQTADTSLTRANADYRNTHVFISSDYQPADQIDIYGSLQYMHFKRGVPGPISFPSPARQDDEVYRIGLGSKWNASNVLTMNIGCAYSTNDEIYKEAVPFIPTDLLYKSKAVTVRSEAEYSPAVWSRILGGIEYGDGWLDVKGVSWGVPFSMQPERVQKSVYLSNEVFLTAEREWLDRVLLFQTIRYDGYSDIRADAVSPKFGINLRVKRTYNVHVRSSWGKNFRVPTFNDLYYPNYSNTALAPERASAFDLGMSGFLDASGRQTLEAAYFYIRTTDKIVTGTDWRPYNIGESVNAGIEVRYDYHSIDSDADVYFSFTLIDAMKKNKDDETDSTWNKQLVYVPKSSGTFGASIESKIGRISMNNCVTGLRYTNADNTKSLAAYIRTDISVTKKIIINEFQAVVRCSINNVFDVDYQSILDYPMPGRTFRIGLGVEY